MTYPRCGYLYRLSNLIQLQREPWEAAPRRGNNGYIEGGNLVTVLNVALKPWSGTVCNEVVIEVEVLVAGTGHRGYLFFAGDGERSIRNLFVAVSETHPHP